jgi:hypothetical protein
MGRMAVPLHLVEAGVQRVAFANPQRGFPARIVYWREGDEQAGGGRVAIREGNGGRLSAIALKRSRRVGRCRSGDPPDD